MIESDIEQIVKARCHPRTEPVTPPSLHEWQTLERDFGCELPMELFYIRVLGARYWIKGDHLPIDEMRVVHEKEQSISGERWDTDLLPFYLVGNGDCVCVRRSEGHGSAVYYWAHDDPVIHRLHESIAGFIQDPDWFP